MPTVWMARRHPTLTCDPFSLKEGRYGTLIDTFWVGGASRGFLRRVSGHSRNQSRGFQGRLYWIAVARTTNRSTPQPIKGMEAKKKSAHVENMSRASDDNALNILRAFAQKDYDLIIGIGFAQKEASAGPRPSSHKHFAICRPEVTPQYSFAAVLRNTRARHRGGIAAMTSNDGGSRVCWRDDVPLIRRFEMGYEPVAKKVNRRHLSLRIIAG